jgi:hypothetical protein
MIPMAESTTAIILNHAVIKEGSNKMAGFAMATCMTVIKSARKVTITVEKTTKEIREIEGYLPIFAPSPLL